MRTSSMLTRQISFRARRLWRAQTNPYAAANLARARTTDPHLRAPINDQPRCRSCVSEVSGASRRVRAFEPRLCASVPGRTPASGSAL